MPTNLEENIQKVEQLNGSISAESMEMPPQALIVAGVIDVHGWAMMPLEARKQVLISVLGPEYNKKLGLETQTEINLAEGKSVSTTEIPVNKDEITQLKDEFDKLKKEGEKLTADDKERIYAEKGGFANTGIAPVQKPADDNSNSAQNPTSSAQDVDNDEKPVIKFFGYMPTLDLINNYQSVLNDSKKDAKSSEKWLSMLIKKILFRSND